MSDEEQNNERAIILHMLSQMDEDAYEELIDQLRRYSDERTGFTDDLVEVFDKLFSDFNVTDGPPDELLNKKTMNSAREKLLGNYEQIITNPLAVDSLMISTVEYGLRTWMPDLLIQESMNEEDAAALIEMNNVYLTAITHARCYREAMASVDETLLMLSPALFRAFDRDTYPD